MTDQGNITTPDAGDLNAAARKYAASQGWAMEDGSYPIRPANIHGMADLEKAIHAVGRGSGSHDAIRAHIKKRAAAIGASDSIPDDWTSNRSSTRVSIPADVPVEIRNAVAIEGVDFEQREIELIAVPYGERAVVEYRGRVIQEEVDPGAFTGVERRSDHVSANRDHDYRRTFGRAIGYDVTNPRGLVARIKVSNTPLGDETLTLANDGVLKASVGMLVRRSDQTIKDGVRRVHKAFLDHIALVPNPAYTGAGVLAVRQQEQAEVEEFEPTEDDLAAWDTARRMAELAEKYTSRQ